MSRVGLLGGIAAAVIALTGCDLGTGTKCADGCPAGTVCDTSTGLCSVSGIELVTPDAQTGRVRSPVLLRARLRMSDRSKAPASLTFRARLDGGTPTVLELLRVAEGEYEATWTEDRDGAYEIEVSGENLTALERTLIIDNTPPAVTVEVEEKLVDLRPEIDPRVSNRDPNALDAWKRDDVLTVRVSAAEDAVAFWIALKGHSGPPTPMEDAGTPLPEQALTEPCPGNARCMRTRVDLSQPEFQGFRGEITVLARVIDLAGNTGEKAFSIPVTRFAWKRQLEQPLPARHAAVGTGGQIYVLQGSDPPALVALAPSGADRWVTAVAPAGAVVEAGPTVHPWGDAGTEWVFVGYSRPETDAGYLAAVPSSGGQPTIVCGPLPGHLSPHLAIQKGNFARAGGGPAFAVIASLRSGALVGATGPNDPCVVSGTTPGAPGAGHALTVVGDEVHYTTATQASGWRFDGGSFGQAAFLPAELVVPAIAYNAAGTTPQNLLGAGRFGTADAGALVFSTTGRSEGIVTLTNLVAGPGASSALAPDVLVFGSASRSLFKADTKARTVIQSGDVGLVEDAPLVANQELYVTSAEGQVAAFDSNLRLRWEESVAATAAPLLFDCARDGGTVVPDRPGTLLVQTDDGYLYAFVVDSTGLASTPLPRWQHDVRNTGNALFPTECP